MEITIDQAKSSEFYLNEFISENSKLVSSIIRKYFSYATGTPSYEDFYQIGMLGLLKATKNFDISYGTKFSTYAVPMIIGEIKRNVRDGITNGQSVVHFNRETRQLISRYNYFSNNNYTKQDIMEELDINEEKYNEIKNFCQPLSYLDDVIHHSDSTDITLGDKLDSEYNLEEVSINNIELEQKLSILKEILTKTQYNVLQLYLDSKTQMEIKDILHISQVQVSRILMKITRRICPAINMFYEGNISKDQMLLLINNKKHNKSKQENNKKEYIIKEEPKMSKAKPKLTPKHTECVYKYALAHKNEKLSVRNAWRENNLPIVDGCEYAVKHRVIDRLKNEGYNVVEDGRKWWISDKTEQNAVVEEVHTENKEKINEFNVSEAFQNIEKRVDGLSKLVEESLKPAEVICDAVSLKPRPVMSFDKEFLIDNQETSEIMALIKTAGDLAKLLDKKVKINIKVEIE